MRGERVDVDGRRVAQGQRKMLLPRRPGRGVFLGAKLAVILGALALGIAVVTASYVVPGVVSSTLLGLEPSEPGRLDVALWRFVCLFLDMTFYAVATLLAAVITRSAFGGCGHEHRRLGALRLRVRGHRARPLQAPGHGWGDGGLSGPPSPGLDLLLRPPQKPRSPERIDHEDRGARVLQNGGSGLRLGTLPELPIPEPCYRADGHGLPVWRFGFVVPDDDLRSARPHPPVQPRAGVQRAERTIQVALDGPIVESDGSRVDLVGIELHVR